jgi:hypothetical protein
MSAPPRFRSVMTPPPGGLYFYEAGGERVEARTWPEMWRKASALMAKNGIAGPVEWAVAEYMCPRVSEWYCTSGAPSPTSIVRMKEAKANAAPFFRRNLVTFDRVSERLRTCAECPRHRRDVCPTCAGVTDWIGAMFGGRRTPVLEDQLAGTCTCCRTFESVVASVEYDESEPPFDGAPDTCWRNET